MREADPHEAVVAELTDGNVTRADKDAAFPFATNYGHLRASSVELLEQAFAKHRRETARAAIAAHDSTLRDQLAAAEARVERLRKALERIGRPLDCGCRPCTGECRSQTALQCEVEERQDIALAALKDRP